MDKLGKYCITIIVLFMNGRGITPLSMPSYLCDGYCLGSVRQYSNYFF